MKDKKAKNCVGLKIMGGAQEAEKNPRS